MNNSVLVGMSGGVDSSVAAYLLREQGFQVTGATMKLFDNAAIGEEMESTCCSLSDVEDARRVAYALQIPHFVFNFSEDFRRQVMERFVHCYECGLTPNPCIDCNRYLKFERMLRRAKELDIWYVATGHYARRSWDGNRWLLKKGLDPEKDQSYFLYHLNQIYLEHYQLPLGELTKHEVREIAAEQGFGNARKKIVRISALFRMAIMAPFWIDLLVAVVPRAITLMQMGKYLGITGGIRIIQSASARAWN